MAEVLERACPACGGANPVDAKFCATCGKGLIAECPSCGHHNPPGAGFCTECGARMSTTGHEERFASPQRYTPDELAQKIRAGRSEFEGERKLITAMFADVAGFTQTAAALDPEDVHDIMTRCFDLMLVEVHRFEGTVSQFLGDGMLALFGAPIAHEDHALRAARAALAIQAALGEYQAELSTTRGIDFRVRIGLNSGPVVVGSVGVDLSMNYLAVGDTMNLAARMQTLSPPGSVAISRATHDLVSGYFELNDLGEFDVKGKGTQRAWEVVKPSRWRSRIDVANESGLVPFVGRGPELDSLIARFHDAAAGRGQIVLIEGEAGVGKSRLLHEFRERLNTEDAAWRVGRCISYGASIPYVPIIDVLKDAYRIDEIDDEGVIRKKVAEGIGASGADPASIPYLEHLLAVGAEDVASMDPRLRKSQTFTALRGVALAVASSRTVVATIEDLHWADPASIEFLSFLIEAIPEHRILLLLTYRPGWDQPFGAGPHVTRLRLPSLSASDGARVAEAVLGAGSLPEELSSIILSRSEGNPFFIEEVTRSLLESGSILASGDGFELTVPLAELQVPNTIRDVIMARLDRLDEAPRRALQTASVIGREFTARLLERAAELGPSGDVSLRELKATELIYERSLFPELVYMFKHALTHDVAYESLLIARRKTLHALVGDVIQDLYSDRLAEQFEMLAYHYERGERWRQAFDFLTRSAEKALAAMAAEEASGFLEHALAVSARATDEIGPGDLVSVHLLRGLALDLREDHEGCHAAFEEAIAAAQIAGDLEGEGTAHAHYGYVLMWAHRFEDALAHAEQAHKIALRTGSEAVDALSMMVTVAVSAITGDLDGTRTTLDAMDEMDLSGTPAAEGLALMMRGFVHAWAGHPLEAIPAFERARALWDVNFVIAAAVEPAWAAGVALCHAGRYDEALEALRTTLERSAQAGEKRIRCRVLNTLGWVYGDLCNRELAFEYDRLAVEESRAYGEPEMIRNSELNLGDLYLATGDVEAAAHVLEGVERDCEAPGTWGGEWMKWRYVQHLHASMGDLRLREGLIDEALGYADRCIEAAELKDSPRNVVKGLRVRARARLALGDPNAAAADIERALGIARDVANPPQLWQTLAVLARVRAAQDHPEEAVAAQAEARSVIAAVAAGLRDPVLRETLLATAEIHAFGV